MEVHDIAMLILLHERTLNSIGVIAPRSRPIVTWPSVAP
jgi:hypothetical protein